MKYHLCPVLFLTVIVILYVTSFRKAGSWLIKKNDPVHADAMVILMGSVSDRVLQAVDLYNQGMAGTVIFGEVNRGHYKILEDKGFYIQSTTELFRDAAVSLGIPSDSIIILPGDVTSTQMEAVIVRNYLIEYYDIDTILLISSAQHTRRASMIFRSAFRKSGVQACIVTIPSSYSGFTGEKWWKSRNRVETVFMEYLKIADFMLFGRWKL